MITTTTTTMLPMLLLLVFTIKYLRLSRAALTLILGYTFVYRLGTLPHGH